MFRLVGILRPVSPGNARLLAGASGFIVIPANDRARQIDARGGTVPETRPGADPRARSGLPRHRPSDQSHVRQPRSDGLHRRRARQRGLCRHADLFGTDIGHRDAPARCITIASTPSPRCSHVQSAVGQRFPGNVRHGAGHAGKPAKKSPARLQAVGAATAGLTALRSVGGATRSPAGLPRSRLHPKGADPLRQCRLSPTYGMRPQPVVSPTIRLWLDGPRSVAEEAPGRLRILALPGRGIASPEDSPAHLYGGHYRFRHAGGRRQEVGATEGSCPMAGLV